MADVEKVTEITTETSEVEIPASWMWIKGSNGKASVTTTFVTIAFWVTTLAYVGSIFQTIGPVSFRAFDTGACMAFFGSLCALYFGRRFSENRK